MLEFCELPDIALRLFSNHDYVPYVMRQLQLWFSTRFIVTQTGLQRLTNIVETTNLVAS